MNQSSHPDSEVHINMNKLDLKSIRLARGLSLKDVADKVGVATMTYRNWEFKPEVITKDFILPLSQILDIPVFQLLEIPEKAMSISAPVLGHISKGVPLISEVNITEYRNILIDVPNKHECFYLKVEDDSMLPTFPANSYVLFRQQKQIETGEIGAFLIEGERYGTVKRFKRYSDGLTILNPDNKEYSPILVDSNHPVKILGKAIRVDYAI